jgi:zinc protease
MKRVAALLLTLFALPVFTSAAPPAPEGFQLIRREGEVTEYRLAANDLGVLLLEDHSAPVLTLMITYRVGSRNEVTGTTGATHLLEHLMFKGSKNFNAGNGRGFDTVMDAIGGINNATTSYDRTNYFENLPSDQLDLALELEADRMRGLLLREEDRQPEMTVVRNEFERDENDPASALTKELFGTAYLAHPYHHPVIGWRSDIEKVSIAKLRAFYDTFYWPNNATLTLIGDFKSDAALALIKRRFSAIPRSPQPIPEVYTEEPAQTGQRRVTVRRPGEVGVVALGYKAPPATHRDHAALEVLAAILGEGKTSRLYRALIDTNLAISADAGQEFLRDPNLFMVLSLLAPGATHAQVEAALVTEIEKIKQEGVTPAEVSRAVSKLLARNAYARDGSYAIASQINEPIAVGDWRLYFQVPAAIKTVTPLDVLRVAQTYFVESQSTVGWFIPDAAAAGPRTTATTSPASRAFARSAHYYRDPDLAVGRTPAASATAPSGAGRASATQVAARSLRREINGIDIVTLATGIKDVVTFRGSLNAGDVFNPSGNPAIADLAAAMLDQGTVARDKFEVSSLLEQAGATLSFNAGSHTLAFAGKCLRADLTNVLGLLVEQLRTPRFDPAEFDKVKKQVVGAYQRRLEETDFRGGNAFARAVFPAGHPNHPPSDDAYLAAVAAATLDEVKAFHAACYGPQGARLVLVGDLDDAAIDQTLRTTTTGWSGGNALPGNPPATLPATGRLERVAMPGKTSVSVFIGQPSGLRHRDADHLALSTGTAILGSGFFSARLLAIVRGQEGLTYGIRASLNADTFSDGYWGITGTFAPELLAQGLASTRRELERFVRDGVTAEELATFKGTIIGSYKVALSTTDGLAGALLNALQRDHELSFVDTYPAQVRALTVEQVNAAIKKHLHADRMITVTAGSLPEPAK